MCIRDSLKTFEVYTAMIDPGTMTVSEETRLTTDSYYDSVSYTHLDVYKRQVQEPSEVFFSQASYSADNGTAIVEVRRSGALNSNAEVRLKTVAGTAVEGRDFSKVDRALLFPFGIDHQTVEIPVETKYFTGEKNFEVTLENVASSKVTQERAVVSLRGTIEENAAAAQALSLIHI